MIICKGDNHEIYKKKPYEYIRIYYVYDCVMIHMLVCWSPLHLWHLVEASLAGDRTPEPGRRISNVFVAWQILVNSFIVNGSKTIC